MKRSLTLILCACCLLAAGCFESDAGDSVPGVDPRAEVLEALVDSLAGVNQQLAEEARLKQDFLREYTKLINQTLADLDAITEREGMLRQIRLDLDGGEAGGVGGTKTIEHRIQDNLDAIERYIEENRQHREAFARQQDELDRLARQHRVQVSGLEETIQTLQHLIDRKEHTIAGLKEEAEMMLGRIADLTETNTVLVEENTELREAYYVVGTLDELQRKGIIDRRGGFLRLGRKTHIGDLDAEHFEPANVDTREVYLGVGLKRYHVLSNHRTKASLYTVEEREGSVYLSILNPEAFWKLSRFLVVEVKR